MIIPWVMKRQGALRVQWRTDIKAAWCCRRDLFELSGTFVVSFKSENSCCPSLKKQGGSSGVFLPWGLCSKQRSQRAAQKTSSVVEDMGSFWTTKSSGSSEVKQEAKEVPAALVNHHRASVLNSLWMAGETLNIFLFRLPKQFDPYNPKPLGRSELFSSSVQISWAFW